MANSVVARFVGGSPMAVLVRLVLVSFVVGFLLETLGFEPASLLGHVVRTARHVMEFGLTDVRQFVRILVTGAIVVVPVWLVLRLVDAGRTR
jgi:Family of unknown function (DUF6460)